MAGLRRAWRLERIKSEPLPVAGMDQLLKWLAAL
jgi:hypothetical protein